MSSFDKTIQAYLAGLLSAKAVVASMAVGTPTPKKSTDDVIRDANEDNYDPPQAGTYEDMAAYRAAMTPTQYAALRAAYLARFSDRADQPKDGKYLSAAHFFS